MWDIGFFLGSLLLGFLIGVTMGNLAYGVPIGADGEYAGDFLSMLHPYALMMGVTTVALFMMHGSIYLVMKTEGDLQKKIRGWVNRLIIIFIICYATTTMATLLYVPHMVDIFKHNPSLFIIAILNMLAIANIPREIHKGRDFFAFMSSCFSIAALMVIFGIGYFPHMVYSNPNPEYSLTIYNACSSQKTLGIMLLMAIIGLPVVIAYTVSVYYIFRGKVKLDQMSY